MIWEERTSSADLPIVDPSKSHDHTSVAENLVTDHDQVYPGQVDEDSEFPPNYLRGVSHNQQPYDEYRARVERESAKRVTKQLEAQREAQNGGQPKKSKTREEQEEDCYGIGGTEEDIKDCLAALRLM